MITAKSYFSGAGGMDLGLSDVGIDAVEHFEIAPTCVAHYAKDVSTRKQCTLNEIGRSVKKDFL